MSLLSCLRDIQPPSIMFANHPANNIVTVDIQISCKRALYNYGSFPKINLTIS